MSVLILQFGVQRVKKCVLPHFRPIIRVNFFVRLSFVTCLHTAVILRLNRQTTVFDSFGGSISILSIDFCHLFQGRFHS